MVFLGIDSLATHGFSPLKGKTIGVLCNQASVTSRLEHLLDLLLPLHQSGFLKVQVVFGPQHGLRAHTEDNMIEWEGFEDAQRGWRVCSLYGAVRKPTPEMLKGVEVLVVDLQDVGARYYTFVWTVALCMEACAELGISMWILDRPNPLGGLIVEGPFADPEFASFVGLHPILARHGLTIGELARWLCEAYIPKARVSVIKCRGWKRKMQFPATGLRWLPPSPNMPSHETAMVYPGACLVEGTNLSEGRGTTRPFEIIGAPWLNSDAFAADLKSIGLPGVRFIPWDFQPTARKFAGQICGGVFVKVTDPLAFRPIWTYASIILSAKCLAPSRFQWSEPPYEYETERLPIDILAGSSRLRSMVDEGRSPEWIGAWLRDEAAEHSTKPSWLYSQGLG